jgi:hypothetical protein
MTSEKKQPISTSQEYNFNKIVISNYIKKIETFKGLMTRRNMMKENIGKLP